MTQTSPDDPSNAPATSRVRRQRPAGPGCSYYAHGESLVWLTGGLLALCLAMIVTMLAFVLWQGAGTFWPRRIVQISTHDDQVLLGEINRSGIFAPEEGVIMALPEGIQDQVRDYVDANNGLAERVLVRTENYELTQTRNHWVSDFLVKDQEHPQWAVILERMEWGRFYGFPRRFEIDGEVVAEGPEATWQAFQKHHPHIRRRHWQRYSLERYDIGRVNRSLEQHRLRLLGAWLDYRRQRERPALRGTAREIDLRQIEAEVQALTEFNVLAMDEDEIVDVEAAMKHKSANLERRFADIGAPRLADPLAQVLSTAVSVMHDSLPAVAGYEDLMTEIRALRAENERYALVLETAQGQIKHQEVAEVVRGYAANRVGFMSRVGIYLSRWREFLFHDPREANTEGGVWPAIVGTVTMSLIMSIFVVPLGVLAALYLREYAKAGPLVSAVRIAINNLAGVPSIVFGVFGLGFFCYIVGGGIDWLFYEERLPSPTFGKGGLLWASATLALLTLPVVIVATEEALAAVPGSMRQGSYACGASKWQTIKRIVLPRAMPGIMTGMILAMARGAGEVAPLMLVGAVKLAPNLPVDIHNWSGSFGFIPTGPIHADRSFMHLGFHIYDVGFQSPDSEAARPMVFTTTLLLISLVVFLNIAAMWLRSRLRRRFAGALF